jgi:zinc D-Ala-D-Ala carboxypeptidase
VSQSVHGNRDRAYAVDIAPIGLHEFPNVPPPARTLLQLPSLQRSGELFMPLLQNNAAGWNAGRWPHFSLAEIACRCCGELAIWPEALDALERLRRAMAAPLVINSGHRCALHNARVGGAPLSLHKKLAFDVALGAHDPARLFRLARAAGFRGFGFGQTFLHLDTRANPARWFYGHRSKLKWTSLGVS